MTANISEQIKVDHALSYVSVSNSNTNTTYFSLANYDRMQFIMDGGVIAGTVECEIRQSLDNNVSNSKVITGAPANITVTTNAANVIEVRTSLLDVANAYSYVGVRVSGNSAGVCNVAGVAIRYPARFKQASLLS